MPAKFQQPYTPTHQPRPKQPPDADLVDNWEMLFSDDFEGAFPPAKCAVFDDSDDDLERFWDDDTYKSYKRYG